jgi:hypothetical protein
MDELNDRDAFETSAGRVDLPAQLNVQYITQMAMPRYNEDAGAPVNVARFGAIDPAPANHVYPWVVFTARK